jgi:hypothetical protein
MSEDLKQFFLEYKKWLDDGAPYRTPFSRFLGLCGNLSKLTDIKNGEHSKVNRELKSLLSSHYGNSAYPFGWGAYLEQARTEQMHLCPKRNSFVNKMIEEIENNRHVL